MTERPAFEIRAVNGHTYKIFADGRIEGFEKSGSCVIVNRIALLIQKSSNDAWQAGRGEDDV
jgi:hypothetical protein